METGFKVGDRVTVKDDGPGIIMAFGQNQSGDRWARVALAAGGITEPPISRLVKHTDEATWASNAAAAEISRAADTAIMLFYEGDALIGVVRSTHGDQCDALAKPCAVTRSLGEHVRRFVDDAFTLADD